METNLDLKVNNNIVVFYRKLLLAWDGQWFLKVKDKYDLKTAIEINKRVRISFARIEARELLKNFHKDKPFSSFYSAIIFLKKYLKVGQENEMNAKFKLTENGVEVYVYYCPAFENIKKANLSQKNYACTACAGMWKAWLSRLMGLKENKTNVKIKFSLSNGDKNCLLLIWK